jgi:tRNA(Ile)-lysidine synthase
MGASPMPASQRGPAVTRLRRAVARALDHGGAIAPGERVVVACSGGPDSTALLDSLARLAPPRRLELHVAHVDHRLRAGSAGEAATVQALAEERGLPFSALQVDVEPGGSLQERARVARHRALSDVANRLGAGAIALGHTADDQAETVLMRLLRGATPCSLAAMGLRDGRLARPLLRVWRADTCAYCAELGLVPVDDPSNRDPRHLRTRVRLELLPALEAVFPGARRRLCVLADRQRQLAAERDRAAP